MELLVIIVVVCICDNIPALLSKLTPRKVSIESALAAMWSRHRSARETKCGWIAHIGNARVLYSQEKFQDHRLLETIRLTVDGEGGQLVARFDENLLIEPAPNTLTSKEICNLNRILQIVRTQCSK